tara:strand:+ start:32872 stop:33081 length:210 start_codon:yes stop_codon:yes gene_type:complete
MGGGIKPISSPSPQNSRPTPSPTPDRPLHTSLLGGFNNKIKIIKRMAYGFHDDKYFFLKIRSAFPEKVG